MADNRIQLTDSYDELAENMSDGIPAVKDLVLALLDAGPEIDPNAGPLGGLMSMIQLDALRVYGERIRTFHGRVCGGCALNTLAVLRAQQLGLISGADIVAAIDSAEPRLDPADLLRQVRKELPPFGR